MNTKNAGSAARVQARVNINPNTKARVRAENNVDVVAKKAPIKTIKQPTKKLVGKKIDPKVKEKQDRLKREMKALKSVFSVAAQKSCTDMKIKAVIDVQAAILDITPSVLKARLTRKLKTLYPGSAFNNINRVMAQHLIGSFK